ncbi:carbohydrate ABC transporter permease, partial [Paenibacillus sp. TAF58]
MTTLAADQQTVSARRVRRRGKADAGQRIWFSLAIILLVLFCVLPFYWMLVSSLKGPQDILDNRLIPIHPTLLNYAAVFGDQNSFALALRNSVIIAGSVTVLALILGVFASYALARLKFRGKAVVLAVFLATAMFPGASILTPLFQLFANLGWIDTY